MVNFFLIFLNCQRLNMAEQYPSGLPLGCRNDEAIKDPQDNLKTFHVIHYPSNFRHAIKVIMAHMKHFWMVFVTQKLQNLSESPFQVLPQSMHKMAKKLLLTHFAISEPLAHLVKKENLFRRLQEGQVFTLFSFILFLCLQYTPPALSWMRFWHPATEEAKTITRFQQKFWRRIQKQLCVVHPALKNRTTFHFRQKSGFSLEKLISCAMFWISRQYRF